MSLTEKLAAERRARLAAERLLDLKSHELFEANRKLSNHALKLSDQIVEQRQEVRNAHNQAAELQNRNQLTMQELERAEEKVEIVERRLWDSVEAITDGFAVFDQQDRLIAANSAWLSLFDYSDLVQPGMSYMDLLCFASEEGIFDLGTLGPSAWIARMLDRWDKGDIQPMELQLWDGRYFRLMDRRSRDGDMVCLAQDITTMKAREEDLREARVRAEAANRAKSAFLANMSHELRTPMNGVVAMADLMLEGELVEEQELYLRTIRSSGETLLGIINDVLDFSKLEAEKMTLRPGPFDLELLLHEVLTLVAPMAREKALDLHVDYDLFLPTRLVGDGGRIRQVLTNLIGNAVKFTPSGHVLVRVVGMENAEDGWQIHITVEDTGIGIDSEMQDHIFQSFSQVEEDRNRNFEGTGLGLAICREIVELMGGQVWVESEKGAGSCFGLRVNLTADEDHEIPLIRLEPVGMRALMVGGGDLDQDILSKQLRQLGMVVHCVQGGSQALATVHSDPAPQIVLIDERLPDTSGPDLAVALRQAGLHAATVLLCADAHQAMSRANQTVVDATLARPIQRDDLFRTLETLSTAQPPAAIVPPPEALSHPLPAPPLPDAAADPQPAPAVGSDPMSAATPTDEPPAARFCSLRARRPAATEAPQVPPIAQPAPVAAPPSGFMSQRTRGDIVPAPPPAAEVPPPRHPAPATPDPRLDKVGPGNDPAPPDGPRQMRILAAEDNRTNRLVFQKMVQSLDVELAFATNGREAVDLYQSFHPDMIFMDISMPEMDGKEATRTIRGMEAPGAHMPIVALTAHAMAGNREEILAAGLDQYLTKPLKKAPITELVVSHCPSDCRPPETAQITAAQ
jgi:signal transduction histidine kinase/CheY-like chemotaxis protein